MTAQILIQFAQQGISRFPADAGIGDGHAVFHITTRLFRRQITFVDITFDHQANDGTLTILNLCDDGFRNRRLAAVVFIRIPMAAIYHQ